MEHTEGLSTPPKVIIVCVYALLILSTLFGNSLMFKAFYSFTSLRTASNCILMSLVAADSLMVVVFILNIVTITIDRTTEGMRTKLIVCYSSALLGLLLISVIILHLALISVERLIAIKFSLRYHTLVTKRRALIASVVVWLWGVAVTIVFSQALRADDKTALRSLFQALHPCYKEKDSINLPTSTTAYLIFLVSSLLVIPILIIVGSYSYIFAVSYKHRKQIQDEAAIQGAATMKCEIKGARTVAIVVGMCLVSFLPLLVVTCCRLFVLLKVPPPVMYSAYFAASLNACWNPLIYGWRNEEFRGAFRKIFKRN